ncbi:hypothetical protein DDQ68_02720 [Hymenobacter nivis]|uniref:Uncharacterized protein n=1 Tax=Hymenobacter nivis TaxID=1850093 RepID=A0A2Z3GHX5_9BACT|nr:hypothetical protein DDQ68_02720 [Hymenobacter nivis]
MSYFINAQLPYLGVALRQIHYFFRYRIKKSLHDFNTPVYQCRYLREGLLFAHFENLFGLLPGV